MSAISTCADAYSGMYTNNSTLEVPEGVTTYILPDDFNGTVSLPSTLEHVQFGTKFNTQVNLPESLKTVRFGSGFNVPGLKLPMSLQHIYFESFYEYRLDVPPLCCRWTKDVQIWGRAPVTSDTESIIQDFNEVKKYSNLDQAMQERQCEKQATKC